MILALGALAIWAWLERSARGLLVGAAIGITGAAAESFFVHHGLFSYLPGSDNLYGVPSWLPWIYLGASVAVGNLQHRIR